MNVDGDVRHLTSEEIQDLLDQALPPGEEARVREHLDSCVRCASEVEAWSLLFSGLGSLPDLSPGPSFSKAILERLPSRRPLADRVRGWLAARMPGRSASGHLSPDGIQEYLDDVLGGRRRNRLEAHLAACAPCREELKAWAAVFDSLGEVGRLSPDVGFPERVMAKVRVPTPSAAPAPLAPRRTMPVPVGLAFYRAARGIPNLLGQGLVLARRVLPRTRKGWAIAGGVTSTPVIAMAALVYLVFSRPLLTVGAFLSYTSWKVSALFGSMVAFLSERLLESATLFRVYQLFEALALAPALVGIGALVISLLCPLALWVLHRNLMVARSDGSYAHVRV